MMKKLCLVLLACVMGLGFVMTGCEGGSPVETAAPTDTAESPATAATTEAPTTDTPASEAPATEAPSTEAPTEAETTPAEPAGLVINADSSCRILTPHLTPAPATDSVYISAEALRDVIKETTGLNMRLTKTKNGSDNDKFVILVGETAYPETQTVLETLPEGGYALQVVGNKLVILGKTENLTVKALSIFVETVLKNPERVTEGQITVLPEDCFVRAHEGDYGVGDMVADGLTVYADFREIIHAAGRGQYAIAQGAASDGTYVYMALRNSDDSGSVILKHRLDDGSFVAVSPVLDLGHANDMTYNTEKNLLVVAHGQKEGKILTIVDPETLEFIKDVDIQKGAGAITYNPATNSYAISQGGKSLHFLDAELGYVKSFTRTKPEGYTAQGMGSDERYIYFPMSGSSRNIFDVFDWEGNPVTYVYMATGMESESMFYVNGKHYVSFNHQGVKVAEMTFVAVFEG